MKSVGSLWSPFKKGLIELIEKVQKRATKILPNFKYFAYDDKLKVLKSPTLIYKRYRGI